MIDDMESRAHGKEPSIPAGGVVPTHSYLWCYGSLGIAAHNMLWAAMGGPSRVHGVMAREATPDCSPLEFSLRALPRAR